MQAVQKVVLYSDEGLRGRPYILNIGDYPYLSNYGISNITSARIPIDVGVELYSAPYYGGHKWILYPGDYNNIYTSPLYGRNVGSFKVFRHPRYGQSYAVPNIYPRRYQETSENQTGSSSNLYLIIILIAILLIAFIAYRSKRS